MRKLGFGTLVLLMSSATCLVTASPVIIDFEGLPDSTSVMSQYTGLTFSGTTILTAGISLNELDFPPHSGFNVASDDGGPISILFSTPVLSFGAYFTYAEQVALSALNGSNAQVASASSTFSSNYVSSGNPPNEFLQVSSAGGISKVIITGDLLGGSFVIDDVTYTPLGGSPVPEPSSFFLLLSAVVGMLGLRGFIRT